MKTELIPVFALCTACMGVGRIEYIPHERPKTTNAVVQPREEKCYVCKGDGFIPTKQFIIKGEPITDFITVLNEQSEEVKNAILKRP